MAQPDTYVGVYDRTRWRAHESCKPHVIGCLEDGTVVQGPATDGELVPGITYEFYGRWAEHEKHGRSFRFSMFVVKVPHSRHGVCAYLQKYCHGIGPVVAARIWDRFGVDSVRILRESPEIVAAEPKIARLRFTIEKAKSASQALARMADLEDVKIGLTNLFAGRGFPAALVDECVDRWKVKAVAKITRDPFTLLVHHLSGCGFSRCDRLYADLGLPLGRLKRQAICLWHCLHADTSGNTWTLATTAIERLGQLVGGATLQPEKARQLGERSRLIASRRDSEGVLWLADGERARAEELIANQLIALGQWRVLSETTELRSLLLAS